jgi:tartrate dehydratase beta subunit/fumarate hydratase class I family protein
MGAVGKIGIVNFPAFTVVDDKGSDIFEELQDCVALCPR